MRLLLQRLLEELLGRLGLLGGCDCSGAERVAETVVAAEVVARVETAREVIWRCSLAPGPWCAREFSWLPYLLRPIDGSKNCDEVSGEDRSNRLDRRWGLSVVETDSNQASGTDRAIHPHGDVCHET